MKPEKSKISGHISVLLQEVVENLKVKPGGCYVDGTLGGGGHAEAILKKMDGSGIYVGIDRDVQVLKIAAERLKSYQQQIILIHGVYSDIAPLLKNKKIDRVDGVLLDLGVSSFQLDDSSRGFSFLNEGPLDMRMDISSDEDQTVADLLQTVSEQELESILKNFGEERFARRIAKRIVALRRAEPLSTTKELADLIYKVLPPPFRYKKIHPATRSFQALRIAVNQELWHLEKFLNQEFDFLNLEGRIAIISFHSLEDRLVKRAFRSNHNFKIITKKPIVPNENEINSNPRSRSAKLRVVEKIGNVSR